MRNFIERLTKLSLESNTIREKYQMYYTFLIVAFIFVITSTINIITNSTDLLLITVLGIVIMSSLAAYVRYAKYNKKIVSGTVLILLTITSMLFIKEGLADGFCIIWTLLIPYAVMIVFGIKEGTIISGIIFAELIFFFYIPYGVAMLNYDYNTDFLLRFPIAFLTCYLISIYLEYGRKITADALKKEKERYYELSKRDVLTGAYNRQGFNELIEKCINENQKKPVALLIADIDHFKRINDEYGHTAGDKVLQDLSATMAGIIKKNQHICRWGGEEFAILLYEKGEADRCETVANELISTIENRNIIIDDLVVRITVSIGCAYADEMKIEDKEKLFNVADVSLYEAKANGRNQAVFNII